MKKNSMKILFKFLVVLLPFIVLIIIKYYPLILVSLLAEKPEKQSYLIQSTESFLEKRYNKKFEVLSIEPTNQYQIYEGRVASQEQIYFNVYEKKMKEGMDIQNDYALKLWASSFMESFFNSNQESFYEIEFSIPGHWMQEDGADYWDRSFYDAPEKMALNLHIYSKDKFSREIIYSVIKLFQEKGIKDVEILLYSFGENLPDKQELKRIGVSKFYENNQDKIIEKCTMENYKTIHELKDIEFNSCTNN